jgi:predicted nucleic acid-binding protein
VIVLDASAVATLLLDLQPEAGWVGTRLRGQTQLCAPHLMDVEVASAIRRRVLQGELTDWRARAAVADLESLPVRRYPMTRLLERIWDLRHNLTAYDAAYVVLAEALDAPFVTTDSALARSSGHRATIEAYPSS